MSSMNSSSRNGSSWKEWTLVPPAKVTTLTSAAGSHFPVIHLYPSRQSHVKGS